MFNTDGKREFSELEMCLMEWMLWVVGAIPCEFHAYPRAAQGMAIHGDHVHALCKECGHELVRQRQQYQQDRARWN